MTDHKFTNEELQKCIECCIKAETWGDCEQMRCPASTKQGCRFYLRTDEEYENTIYKEILKDVLGVMKKQKTEWISVEEGLPKEKEVEHIIVCDEDGTVGEAIFLKASRCFEWIDNVEIAFATHWMPLPEAPKGDKTDA